MDWYTWLSKTGLDPPLVYEHALTFTNNELEKDDIAYFSHEFLQSMGISIAKHRLEILKLARKEKGTASTIHPIQWLMFAIKRTRNYLAKHIRAPFHRESSASSLSIVPIRNNSLRWKLAMMQRNNKSKGTYNRELPTMIRYDTSSPRIEFDHNKVLMITNGSPSYSIRSSSSDESKAKMEESGDTVPNSNSFSSTKVHSQDEYWSSSTEEIKWDSMFKNLKPT